MGQELFSGTLGIVIMLVVFIAVILWFFLPFAIFGTKARIDELIQINKKTSVLLESINVEITQLRKESNLQKNIDDKPPAT